MAYMATLDVRDICISVVEINVVYSEDCYIEVPSNDQSLVGKWYNRSTQQFETPTFNELAYHSTDEINVGTTDQSLTDALNAKMPKSGGAFTGEVSFGSHSAKDVLSVEFKPSSTANHGGFIDFHFNGSTADYTARIIESAEGKLNAIADNGFQVTCGTGSVLLGNNIMRLGGMQTFYNSGTMMNIGTGYLPLNLIGKDAIYSTHSIQVTSDIRMKENFKPLNPQQMVNFIQALNVTEFNYKGNSDKKVGLIAQQVQLADPEFSERFVKTNPETGMLSINYTDLINPLIVTVQALMNEVVDLRAKVEAK